MSDYTPSKAMAIKRKVRDGLKAADTAAGQRVFVQRDLPEALEELPCILIFDGGEDVVDDALIGQPRAYGCDLLLFVAVITASGSEEQEETLDLMVQAVRQVMQADESWGGLARSTIYQSRHPVADEEGRVPLATEVLLYKVNFFEPSIPGE